MEFKRVQIDYTPFFTEGCATFYSASWARRGLWKALWIANGKRPEEPECSLYKNIFSFEKDERLRLHLSFDSVGFLYLDGRLVARGSELGYEQAWPFESYDCEIERGRHVLTALVLSFGTLGPFARISLGNAFLLGVEGSLSGMLDTNSKNWSGRRMPGVAFRRWPQGSVGPETTVDFNAFPAELLADATKLDAVEELGNGRKTVPGIEYQPPCRLLEPALLPERNLGPIRNFQVVYASADAGRLYEEKDCLTAELPDWTRRLEEGRFSVAPHTTRKLLVKLDDYYCGVCALTCGGGKDSSVSVSWSEALELPGKRKYAKDDRNGFLNRVFSGQTDKLVCGERGGFLLAPWYRAGRYVELLFETKDEPLTVERLRFEERRYPLEMAGGFRSSDPRLDSLVKPAVRTLQMCMQDTYLDCPYYEQLMYLGDARLEMLLNYALSNDRRLAKKSLRLIAAGRMDDGLLQSRFPSRVVLAIPPFSMLFASLLNDYAKYSSDQKTVREVLPRLHEVMQSFEKYRNEEGFLVFPDSWNFVDWTPEWGDGDLLRKGSAPESSDGVSALVNWNYVYALSEAAELHSLLGEKELAARYRRLGKELSSSLVKRFFRAETGLLADTDAALANALYSEHSHCFALLSGFLEPELARQVQDALFSPSLKMTRASIYFSFYYLEACVRCDRMDKFMERLALWSGSADLGLCTLPETSEPTRSDCHAWSAHVLWHFFASILGVRPVAAGYGALEIAPHPGLLSQASGSVPHPNGMIEVAFERLAAGHIHWRIAVPEGVRAEFTFGGERRTLSAGRSEFDSSAAE